MRRKKKRSPLTALVVILCLALLGGQLRRFELRYGVRAHRWTLWQFLDRDVPASR